MLKLGLVPGSLAVVPESLSLHPEVPKFGPWILRFGSRSLGLSLGPWLAVVVWVVVMV